jgi:uncharacterized protein YkwD
VSFRGFEAGALAWVLTAASACVRSQPNPLPAPRATGEAEAKSAPPAVPLAPAAGWQAETRSPRASTARQERQLAAHCDERDAALDAVALELAERAVAGRPPLDPTEIHFALRTEGSPYVWVRAWSLDGEKLDDKDIEARVERWLGGFDEGGRRRCGFGRQAGAGREVVFAVAADALAELEPLPTRVRAGSWLTVRAKMLVPASEAKVVVLGPRGAPKPIPTSLSGNALSATFSADRPGTWMVQVVASVDGGPRPVAEALVNVNVTPPPSLQAQTAPGEDASEGVALADEALLAMVNRARASERLRALARHPALDAIAKEHALAMQAAGRLRHDVGGGGAADRMRQSNLRFRGAGENVARAASIRRAHRALWASPSHRGNVLDTRFDAIGIGVAEDPDGSVWVCEVFAAWR